MTPTDLAIDRYPAASDPDRLLKTPAEEVHLALRPEPRAPWADPGFGAVFILTNEANNLARIGCTARLRKRYTGLNVDSPVHLDLAHFVHVAGLIVARQIELALQTTFLACRRRGEWFDVAVADAAQELADTVYRRRLRFWSELERRQVGAMAARVEARRG